MQRTLTFALLHLALIYLGHADAGQLRDGDIIFQTSRSAQSVAIQNATGSRYSHMGMILLRKGSPFVYEAIGPVQYTPLAKWAKRGEGGHYIVKRLREADRLLAGEAVERLRRTAEEFRGKPYDLAFGWSDERIYCSELVWKIYDRALGLRIGRLQKLREFDLTHPAVRVKIKERYGDRIPLDETVISPGEMFASEDLTVVEER